MSPAPSAPNRRDFLRGTAGTLASLFLARRAPALVRRRHSDTLRIAVIGTGGRGCGHLKALGYTLEGDPLFRGAGVESRYADVEVVAVCDAFDEYLDAARRAVTSAGGSCAAYTDHRKLLEEQRPDAVIVATPDHLHVPISIDALQAGAHVYVEKCMSNSIEEAKALGAAVTEHGRVLQVGHQARQDNMHLLARKIIEQGALGDVHLAQCFLNRSGPTAGWNRAIARDGGPPRDQVHWEQFLGPAPSRPYDPHRFFEWRHYWDYSTGIAGDLMSHEVDRVHDLLGLDVPATAVASGGIYHFEDARETPDTYTAALEYPERGVSLTYNCTLSNSFPKRATLLMGTEATMELDWEIRVYADRHSTKYAERIAKREIRPVEPFIHVTAERGGDRIMTAAPSELWLEGEGLTITKRDGRKASTTRLHLEDFAAAIREGREPTAGFDQAWASTVATHMSTLAFQQGRSVGWDAERQQAV